MGSGVRVPLGFLPGLLKIRLEGEREEDVRAMAGATGIGFFPGAIVGLKGKNGSGERFLVSEVLRVGVSLCFLCILVIFLVGFNTASEEFGLLMPLRPFLLFAQTVAPFITGSINTDRSCRVWVCERGGGVRSIHL